MKRPGKILGLALTGLYKKPATVAYPAGPLEINPLYRGLLKFDSGSCNGCQLCVKDCPCKALRVENIGTKEEKEFKMDFDMSLCIFCGQCVDSCRRGCLALTPQIELAVLDKEQTRVTL